MEDELSRLSDENARLKTLLTRHDIDWIIPAPPKPVQASPESPPSFPLAIADKIALFRRLFKGREDVYPRRWESSRGTTGYAPVCGNEWKPGICHKPKVKCGSCGQRLLQPVTDQVIYDHLAGKQTIGVYPLLGDETCSFLAADFDEAGWREDAQAFLRNCDELGGPAARMPHSDNFLILTIFQTVKPKPVLVIQTVA